MFTINTKDGEVRLSDLKAYRVFRSAYPVIEAAGGLVMNTEGSYLFIFRRGCWDLPKGKRDEGESIEQAAVREVGEETALSPVEIIKKINVTYHIYTMGGRDVLKETHWYLMVYRGSQVPVPERGENISVAGWYGKDELEGLLENTYPNIRRLVKDFLDKNPCEF